MQVQAVLKVMFVWAIFFEQRQSLFGLAHESFGHVTAVGT